jgi:hypothetical protein
MLYFVFNSIPSNWFFRGISYALVGDQEQFEETRNMITYWMAQNKKKIDQIFGPDYFG